MIQPISKLSWYFQAMGFSGLFTLVFGLALFVGACLVVIKARRPALIAAYLVFLPLPLLVATISVLKGFVAAFSVMALSGAQLAPSEWYAGLAETALVPLMALLVTMPSYLVIAIGLFVRMLRADGQPTTQDRNDLSPGASGARKLPDAA